MVKLRSLAIVMLGLACFLLIACQTGGTPKQSGGTPTKSRLTAEPKATHPADSASKKRTASYSKNVVSVASPQLKDLKGKAVHRLGSLSRLFMGKKVAPLRAVLYATLAVILMAVIGAVAAERAGRRRKLTPSSVSARH